MRTFASAAFATAITLAYLPMDFAGFGQPVCHAQVRATAKSIDDLLEWIGRTGKGMRSPAEVDEFVGVLRKLGSRGEDVSSEVAALIRRDFATAPLGVIDAKLLELMTNNPAVRNAAWELAKKASVRDPGSRIALLVRELGDSAPGALEAICRSMNPDEAQLLMRAVSGRMLSRRQVLELTDGLSKVGVAGKNGEIWEVVARTQISGGALKSKSGLKNGGEVIAGQHNSIHGIDGIGASADGTPVIFEFSMNPIKKLEPDSKGLVQLGPGWTADRWHSMITKASPDQIADLRRIGIDPKWLDPNAPVTPSQTSKWGRKLVVAHDSALSNTNRIAAELGPDDLMVLGGG
jgi:hypothetical protein